ARRLAATVAPYSAPRRPASRVEGGFDFFGTKAAEKTRAAIEAVQHEDLADVVGAEALAAHRAESAPRQTAPEQGAREQAAPAATTAKPSTPEPSAPQQAGSEESAAGQVIDLTAHDETEPIDVVRLRTAIS
ncbi:hypothetical protein GPJ59_35185, partial [Streptomyces bambusae]|nr:hypothetical protein [Streptomyces bambusae]